MGGSPAGRRRAAVRTVAQVYGTRTRSAGVRTVASATARPYRSRLGTIVTGDGPAVPVAPAVSPVSPVPPASPVSSVPPVPPVPPAPDTPGAGGTGGTGRGPGSHPVDSPRLCRGTVEDCGAVAPGVGAGRPVARNSLPWVWSRGPARGSAPSRGHPSGGGRWATTGGSTGLRSPWPRAPRAGVRPRAGGIEHRSKSPPAEATSGSGKPRRTRPVPARPAGRISEPSQQVSRI